MKQFLLGIVLAGLGWMTWRMFLTLAPDARAVLLTVVVVIVCTTPGIAMLAFAAGKGSTRRREYDDDDDGDDDGPRVTNFFVITNTTNNTDNRQLTFHTPAAQGMPLLADREREIQAQRGGRVFRVVGEREEL